MKFIKFIQKNLFPYCTVMQIYWKMHYKSLQLFSNCHPLHKFPLFQNLEVQFLIRPSSALDTINHINFFISRKHTFTYIISPINFFFFKYNDCFNACGTIGSLAWPLIIHDTYACDTQLTAVICILSLYRQTKQFTVAITVYIC